MQHIINPVNAYIGARLRQARLMRDISQKELGQRIKKPISFQQVQKYEHGTNRISVALLQEFADAMHLPMGFFLPDQDIEFEPVLNKREAELLEHFHGMNTKAQEALIVLLKNTRRGG